MATRKRTPKPQPLGMPETPPPSLKDSLTVSTFEQGVAESKQYLENAKQFAEKAGSKFAGTLFKNTKYSSASAQFGYLAILKLLQGFAAEYPLERAAWASIVKSKDPNELLKKRETFEQTGLTGKASYRMLIKLTFCKGAGACPILDNFENLYRLLHENFHYAHKNDREGFYAALRTLEAYLADLEREARKLLKAAGVAV
jgi:hypothetical protein